MLYNVKEQRIKIKNYEIDSISFGNGEKALIMIQGLNTRGIKGAGLSLAYMYRIFAREYRVYLFDRRPDVSDGITVKELADDVAAAMDTLGLKNADVLGVSEGGMIAQYLAIERPDLVHKLVLAVTTAKNNATVEETIGKWVELTEKNDMKQLFKDMAERMYSESYVRRYKLFMPLLTLLQTPKDKSRFIALAKSCLTCDTYGQLDRIRCPVLVIGGRLDKVVGGEASEEIAERLGCPIYMYEDLGHAAYEEAKDFNSRVFTFFLDKEDNR